MDNSLVISTAKESISTGEEARLAKIKPPIYGHSYLHKNKSASWKAPNGGAISRN